MEREAPATESFNAQTPNYSAQPRNLRLTPRGASSAPMSRRFPEVRGGQCEFCGTLDPNLDGIESQAEQNVKVKNRFQQLSEKVILTSKEKEEAQALAKQESDARLNAEKERDFYKDFSNNVTKYPNASEYQDQILEKVKSGYSTEDAMVSVLAKEGKLNASYEQPVHQPSGQVEGGSAPTSFEGGRSLADMKPEDKLSALTELDRNGDLANALRGR
jgi:hypothetical protein